MKHEVTSFTSLPFELQNHILLYALPIDLCRYKDGTMKCSDSFDRFGSQALAIIFACPSLKELVIKICLKRFKQLQSDYRELVTQHLDIDDKHCKGLLGNCGCHYSMRWSESIFAIDEYYLEGGFMPTVDIDGYHNPTISAQCPEVQRMKQELGESMGYAAESCQKLRNLLEGLNPPEVEIDADEYN